MRLLGLLPLLLLAACDSALDADLDYGDRYTLAIDGRPALSVAEGRITVPVAYSGGCAEHTFRLRSDVSGDDATVWFVHDDGGDMCEAYLGETLDAALPRSVNAAERITLRVPYTADATGEAAIRLR